MINENYDLNDDVNNVVGPVTLSPGLLNRWDQGNNPDFFNQQTSSSAQPMFEPQTQMSDQEAPNQISGTSTLGDSTALQMGKHAVQSIANDSLQTNEYGDLVDPQKAVQLFGGDAEKMHYYLYATNPLYRARHNWWMKNDAPAVPTRGPVEGAIYSSVLPGGFAGNSIKQMGSLTAIDTAQNLWNSRNR